MSEGAPKDVGEQAAWLMSQNSRQKTTWFRALLRRTDFTVGVATSFLYLFFCFSADTFFTAYNQFNLLRTAGCYVFVALSQGMLQIMGGTNLAIGAAGAFSGMFACQAMQYMGWPIWAATLLAIVVGMGTGYITGWIVSTFKLPAFVVTLALQYILNGLVMGYTKGYPFTELPPNIVGLGRAGIGGILPLVTILAVLTLAVLYYVFRYTVIGRQILASGGNTEAARLSGIPTKRIYLIASVLSGLFSAISAIDVDEP